MAAEEKTTQVKLTSKRYICADVTWPGPCFVTPTVARQLVDLGVVEIVGAGAVGPTEFKPAGPAEGKPIWHAEKKFSPAARAGPPIDSQSSSEPGVDAPSSASAAVPHSPLTNADLSQKPKQGRPKKSE